MEQAVQAEGLRALGPLENVGVVVRLGHTPEMHDLVRRLASRGEVGGERGIILRALRVNRVGASEVFSYPRPMRTTVTLSSRAARVAANFSPKPDSLTKSSHSTNGCGR